MTDLRDIGGVKALFLPEQGEPLGGEAGAITVIGDAWGVEADWIVIPTARLTAGSFDLSTRQLGLMLQKFTTYGQRVGFVGPVPETAEQSRAFTDFRRETNVGGRLLFAADEAALAALIGPSRKAG